MPRQITQAQAKRERDYLLSGPWEPPSKPVPVLTTEHKPGDIVIGNALAPAMVRTDTGYKERDCG